MKPPSTLNLTAAFSPFLSVSVFRFKATDQFPWKLCYGNKYICLSKIEKGPTDFIDLQDKKKNKSLCLSRLLV